MNKKKIQSDLNFFSDYEVVIYGSYAIGIAHNKSDIDVAIVTRNSNRTENIKLMRKSFGKAPPIYDIRIFELLPLKIKIDISNQFITIFGNKLDLSEYFYFFRKLWADCKHRIEENQFQNHQEKIIAIKRMKYLYKL